MKTFLLHFIYVILLFLRKNAKVCIQPLVHVPRYEIGHGGGVVIAVVGVEGVVILFAVCEFDVDGRQAAANKIEVHYKASRPAIAVDERVYALELEVEAGDALDRVHVHHALLVHGNQLGDLRLDQVRLHRLGIRAHDVHRDAAENTLVLRLIHKHEGMNVFDDELAERDCLLGDILNVEESVPVADCLEMILERLLIDGDALEDHGRFLEREGVALDGRGIVGEFDHEFIPQAGDLTRRQRAQLIETLTLDVDLGEQTGAGAATVERLRRVGGDHVKIAPADHAGNLALRAQQPDAASGNAPLLCCFRYFDVVHPGFVLSRLLFRVYYSILSE